MGTAGSSRHEALTAGLDTHRATRFNGTGRVGILEEVAAGHPEQVPGRENHMFSMMASPKPEQLSRVASSISRSRS